MENSVRKQSANLSIRSDLLRRARQQNMNLSKTLEDRLEKIFKARDREEWRQENREAVEAANAYIEKCGLWSDGLRRF